MLDKYLLLIADPDTGHWSVCSQHTTREPVDKVVDQLIEGNDPSPRVIIYTGDYVHD